MLKLLGCAVARVDGLVILNLRKKSIFSHRTIVKVWFWPLNAKTMNHWPSNSWNCSLLAIPRFCKAGSLTWLPRGGGTTCQPYVSSLFSPLPPLSLLLSPSPVANPRAFDCLWASWRRWSSSSPGGVARGRAWTHQPASLARSKALARSLAALACGRAGRSRVRPYSSLTSAPVDQGTVTRTGDHEHASFARAPVLPLLIGWQQLERGPPPPLPPSSATQWSSVAESRGARTRGSW
jgi:hypothetical protein